MAKARATAAQRQEIFERAKWRCEYCRTPEPFVPEPFSVEHILPLSKGGKTRLNNLASACSACNGHKYNKTTGIDPLTQKPASLFHPRKQRWQDHFTWSEDALLIVGLTPTGRATVNRLRMNHSKQINLRAILLLAGLHPPQG